MVREMGMRPKVKQKYGKKKEDGDLGEEEPEGEDPDAISGEDELSEDEQSPTKQPTELLKKIDGKETKTVESKETEISSTKETNTTESKETQISDKKEPVEEEKKSNETSSPEEEKASPLRDFG